jgi:cold shock protein
VIGQIKRVVSDCGFGFITEEASGTDFFFHVTSVVGHHFYSLAEGDLVAFDPVEPQPAQGRRARNVRVIPAEWPATRTGSS